MLEIIKEDDITTYAGHTPFATSILAPSNVKAAGKSVVRFGDQWATHNSDPTHTLPTQVGVSLTVKANGLGVARNAGVLGTISCGAQNTVPALDSKVFVGG